MKFLALCLSLLIALQTTCYSAAVAQVSFAGDVLAGQAPVNKVGALLLTEGIAVITATTMDIQSKGTDGSKQSQLQGQLFKTSQSGNTIKGEVYFDRGPGLTVLDRKQCNEFVKMIDGTRVDGAITEVTTSTITCARRAIPMNEVADVHSARVFKFETTVGDKPRMDFQPTCVMAVVTSKSKSGDGLPLTKIILVGTVVAVVTCAIVLPIAITNSYRRHHNHLKNTRQINNFVYNRRSTRSRSRSSSGSGSSFFFLNGGGGGGGGGA